MSQCKPEDTAYQSFRYRFLGRVDQVYRTAAFMKLAYPYNSRQNLSEAGDKRQKPLAHE